MENVAIVVHDTLRKDAFDDEFDWLPGLRFDNAYSASHWTIAAHGSLFTCYYPSEVGVHAKSHTFDCDRPTLAEEFAESSYTIRLWTAQPNIYIWDGWRRGWDEIQGPANLDPEAQDTFDWTAYQFEESYSGYELYLRGVWESLVSDRPAASLLQGYRMVRRSRADGGAKSADGERTCSTGPRRATCCWSTTVSSRG